MGISMGLLVVSREEFDPRKAEHRRRRGMDRFIEFTVALTCLPCLYLAHQNLAPVQSVNFLHLALN
jgi:hypothetical protein